MLPSLGVMILRLKPETIALSCTMNHNSKCCFSGHPHQYRFQHKRCSRRSMRGLHLGCPRAWLLWLPPTINTHSKTSMSDHIIQSPLNTVWASLYSPTLWSLGSEGGRWCDRGPALCLRHQEPEHLGPGLGPPSDQYFHHYFHPWLADDSLSNFRDHKRLWRLLVAGHARGCHPFHSSFYTHQSTAEFSSALVCGE